MSNQSERSMASLGQAILAAAVLLPGVVAHAENAPERTTLAVRYLNYEESQPGLDRIKVHSPSLSLETPIGAAWSLGASLTADAVSGASPRYHTAVSGASRMQDDRSAGDVALTRYFPNASLTVGAAYSTEHDYVSRALSVLGTLTSEDHNTTWSFGVGGSDDAIDPVNFIVRDAARQSINLIAGVTRVLSPNDLAQLTIGYTHGHGYFNDPYKTLDARPDQRDQRTVMLRWNHHHVASDGTSRLSYRIYDDSFGIRAHTLGGEYVQPFGQGWTLTPSLRLYSQRAASFYVDTPGGDGFPAILASGALPYGSADQRLSAFGAVTVGIKLARQLGPDWLADVKLESYRQRSEWRVFGHDSETLAPLRAVSLQVGLSRSW